MNCNFKNILGITRHISNLTNKHVTYTRISQSTRKYASQSQSPQKKIDSDEFLRQPINFFGSKAATWQAKKTRSGGSEETLWYQSYVISASTAIFLIYFCYLREENDIDRKLEGNLFDHISGLEEAQLSLNYKYNKQNNKSTVQIEKRLKELGVDANQL